MKRENTRVKKLVRRNKRRYMMRAAASAVLFAGLLMVIAFSGMVISATSTNAKSPDTGSYEKMYKSVMVEQGDCLWDIADRYMSVGYDDKADYVQEIRELNQLIDSEIHYGDYLCVPYYA